MTKTGDNPVISENEAFLLTDGKTRDLYQSAYQTTRALYYSKQPNFDEILDALAQHAHYL